jgi:hypothetical protein
MASLDIKKRVLGPQHQYFQLLAHDCIENQSEDGAKLLSVVVICPQSLKPAHTATFSFLFLVAQ